MLAEKVKKRVCSAISPACYDTNTNLHLGLTWDHHILEILEDREEKEAKRSRS